MTKFVPVTPGGTRYMHLAGATEEEAWNNLGDYYPSTTAPDRKNYFMIRGYTVIEIKPGTRQWKPSHRNSKRK